MVTTELNGVKSKSSLVEALGAPYRPNLNQIVVTISIRTEKKGYSMLGICGRL